MRKCAGCGEMKPKKDLIRVLKTEEGIVVDMTGRKNGRGVYLCPSLTCLEKAKKSKGMDRSLKMPVPSEIYEELENNLKTSE